MGKLAYDNSLTVDFDDRLLAHLQIVIGLKLRRGESFYFSWRDDQRVGDGRTSIWLSPDIPLVYKYYGSRQPSINRNWLHRLEVAANTTMGLHVLPEPDDATPPQESSPS